MKAAGRAAQSADRAPSFVFMSTLVADLSDLSAYVSSRTPLTFRRSVMRDGVSRSGGVAVAVRRDCSGP
jgi:hypothetical protein